MYVCSRVCVLLFCPSTTLSPSLSPPFVYADLPTCHDVQHSWRSLNHSPQLTDHRCPRFPLGFQTLFNLQAEGLPPLEEEQQDDARPAGAALRVEHVGLFRIGSEESSPYLMVSGGGLGSLVVGMRWWAWRRESPPEIQSASEREYQLVSCGPTLAERGVLVMGRRKTKMR